MELKTSALSISGSGALVGGGVIFGNSLSKSHAVKTIDDLHEEIKEGETIGVSLVNSGLELVKESDNEALSEIQEALKVYVVTPGVLSLLRDLFTDFNDPNRVPEKTRIVSDCKTASGKNIKTSGDLLWDVKMWCTKDISLLSVYRSSKIDDYAPITKDLGKWTINFAAYRSKYSDSQATFDSFRSFCSSLEDVRFRGEKDFSYFEKFSNCLSYKSDSSSLG